MTGEKSTAMVDTRQSDKDRTEDWAEAIERASRGNMHTRDTRPSRENRSHARNERKCGRTVQLSAFQNCTLDTPIDILLARQARMSRSGLLILVESTPIGEDRMRTAGSDYNSTP